MKMTDELQKINCFSYQLLFLEDATKDLREEMPSFMVSSWLEVEDNLNSIKRIIGCLRGMCLPNHEVKRRQDLKIAEQETKRKEND